MGNDLVINYAYDTLLFDCYWWLYLMFSLPLLSMLTCCGIRYSRIFGCIYGWSCCARKGKREGEP